MAAGVYHVANGVVLVTVNVVALRDLGGPSALGVIAAAEGLGGVIGSVIAMRVRPSRPLVAGFLALGLMPVWVLAYVWPGTLTGVLLGAVIGYSGLMFFGVCWETAIQNHVPHDLLARVSSWDILTSFVGMPLGQAMAGVLTDRFGTHQVLTGVRRRHPRRRRGSARGPRHPTPALGAGTGRARLNRAHRRALVRLSAPKWGSSATNARWCAARGRVSRREPISASRRRARSARSAGRYPNAPRMLNAPTTTIATWVDVRASSWPASAAVRLNPRNETIEFIDRTVDRFRAEASRWSSAPWTGPPAPCSV